MDAWPEILERLRQFAEQHVPTEAIPAPLPAAVVAVVLGIVLSVLGARLARVALTVACGVAGVAAAGHFARVFELPLAPTVIGAGLVAGLIGYGAYRLLVGGAVALVVTALALSVFGYYRVTPHLESYAEAYPLVDAQSGADFALLSADEQREYLNTSPEQWARDFWAYLSAREADVDRTVLLISIAAAIVGLLLGLIHTRGAVVITTAVLGTTLVASGLLGVAALVTPDYYRAVVDDPRIAGAAGAALLGCSLVLQTALIRKRPAQPKAEPAG